MASEPNAFSIPNLVQGVSQQAAKQRRETQAESQFDCINSPVNGSEARPPVEVLGFIRGARYSRAWARPIARGTEEYYLAVVSNEIDEGGERLRIFDLDTGEECEVTYTDVEGYLSTDANPRDAIRAATLEDYTFVANKEVRPRMDTDNPADAGFNEGIVYFKAGGYKITYQVAVTLRAVTGTYSAYSNKIITFRYETPDNSTAGNAAFITTNQQAATLFRAFTGGTAVPTTSNTTVVAGPNRTAGTASVSGTGVGAAAEGQAGTVGATTLTEAGFYVALNGNVILIGRTDGAEFSIDTSDGVGDTYLRSVKDQAQAFADLPKSCFVGFTTKVRGSNKQTDDDYWVTYKGEDGQGGFWEETVKPGIVIDVRGDTMPHAIINFGYQQFEWLRPPWGSRVTGDGETKSKDPGFIGKQIEDIFYSHTRLALLTEGSCSWAKLSNPFVYFPTSAQTILDTDPVDIQVGGGKDIALLRKAVQMNDSTFLWAEGIQFKVDSGGDPFKQDTVQAPPTTQYEFASRCDPLPLGQSLYFCTEPGLHATIRDITIQDGKIRGETDVTAHIPKYIPKLVRRMSASDTRNIMFVTSDLTPNLLYTYNYLLSNTERLQSAWNIWRLPTGCEIVWHGVRRNHLHLLIQRGTWGALLCRVDLSSDVTDPEQSDYQTRVDLRLPEGLVTTFYDEVAGTTKILLPFPVPEARGYVEADGVDAAPMFVATRTTSPTAATEGTYRGHSWAIISIAWDPVHEVDVITVRGNARAEEIYVGFRISAEREETEFFLRSPGGSIQAERLQILNVVYSYSQTGYFRAEVLKRTANPDEPVKVTQFAGRTFGDPSNATGGHVIRGGDLRVPVGNRSDGFTLRLVNDSFLPSRWTTASVEYQAKFVARPVNLGARGGSRGGQQQ